MEDKLESKNTYMNYFKLDEAKEREELLEKSKTHVRNLTVNFLKISSSTTWQS